MSDTKFQPFTIRLTQPGDADAFLAVMIRCWTGTVADDSSAYRETPDKIAADLIRGGGALLCAGEEIAGCGRYVPVAGPPALRGRLSSSANPQWVEIKRVGVVSEFRGLGLGARIVESLETEARGCGFPGAQLGVRADQPRLVRFWEGLGYAVADDVTLSNPNPLTPTPVFMRKRF